MAIKTSTLLEYALLAIPLYIFAISPLLNQIFPTAFNSSESANTYQLNEKTNSLVIPDESLVCGPHSYTVKIVHREPLVIYLDHFLSTAESDHLTRLAEETYQQSTVFNGDSEMFDPKIRNSSKALLPRDHVVQCIEQRAREFQGWRPDVYIERLWAQKYEAGGHYTYHFDWSGDMKTRGGGRLSTFMVYLDAECEGGGTKFPRIQKPEGGGWCDYLECGSVPELDGEGDGITFKPRKGAAVYWENFRLDGKGYEETWHAGLPVKSGVKIGLNIWSWWQPGYGEYLEGLEKEQAE